MAAVVAAAEAHKMTFKLRWKLVQRYSRVVKQLSLSPRKILNDLSSDTPAVPRIEEEKSEDDSGPAITTVTMPTPIYQTSSGQYIAITQGGAIQLASNGTDGVQGLQTLTMANPAAAQPGTTILQYAQTSDGQQILVPSNQVVVQGEDVF
ncbi:Cyclic AMP-responsive element-binding protein 1 [Xenoophorus captivus]|uniref:Cyclic AMP-responsive element-binding protein 1 n=1 Tax=Xenoophorus captivus TaxID=1517983 RepID=A0ABV0RPA5_9TELE